jgi:hypothetical protein
MPAGLVLLVPARNFRERLLQALLFRRVLLQALRQTVSMWPIGADVVHQGRCHLELTPRLS